MNVEETINLAVALGKQGRLDESIVTLNQAIAAEPTSWRAHLNLGVAYLASARPEESLASLDRSIELRDSDLLAHHARMKTLMALNRLDEAIAAGRRALQVDPNHAETHGVLAKALLASGDFKRGWAEYEWRWKCESFIDPRPGFAQPRWTGGSIAGKTILLHCEQGFGDTIQFIRYAPLLAERGADVIVRCPRELADLIRRMPTSPMVVSGGEAIPQFDLHAPLLSMPLAFGTTVKTIPAKVPYLLASPAAAKVWQQRVAETDAKLRVGVAWAGRQNDHYGRAKSMRLEMLAPLASPEVAFYSLQKWDAKQEANRPPAGMGLIDLTSRIHDFSDSAALLANMDLVLTVDTVISHLAGAMGRAVWVMLPFAGDFRWFLQRSDSPWYPTMKLFRQPTPGDWASVIETIAGQLRAKVL